MKRYVIILVLVFIFGIGVDKIFFTNKKEEEPTEKNTQKKNTRSLSMMLETGAGTGVYETTTKSTWPTDGYLFNEELSKCENGSKLSWNDENNTVVMTGSTSDKCYVYFDVYTLAVINSLTEETTSSSIKLTVNATVGTKPITKYYYSKDNGISYTESTSNTYTFSGLTKDTTYNIKVYALDENGKSSAVYSKSIKTDNTQMLADYVKSLHTTQGANGLYLHNSSLTNGAGDNSYRFAGANPNNYVCFGTDSAATCPNDNLYRIIGVFGDQVKLIKEDFANSNLLGTTGAYSINTYSASNYLNYKGSLTTINRYYWTSSNNKRNVWSGSELNTINLNETFLSSLETSWINMIVESIWKVGGNAWEDIAMLSLCTAYQNEIISPVAATTYSAKIGLMYVSDYGYAASPTYWTYKGIDTATTDYRAAVNDNWLYSGISEWTITRRSNNSFTAFLIGNTGYVDGYGTVLNGSDVGSYVYTDNHGIRPCFYLNSNVTYSSGTGEKNSPIRIN